MQNIILQYESSGSTFTRSFNIFALRGLDRPDEVRIVGVQHNYLNGVLEEQTLGFNKIITVDFGVIQNQTEVKFLCNFLASDKRQIRFNQLFADVVLDNPGHYENEWLDGIAVGRRFITKFIDTHLYKQWTETVNVSETMYLKSKVQIIGTADAPEQLETNVGKLTTDETGNSYPAFNASTHVFFVTVDGAKYQEAGFGIVDKPTVVGGNLRFTVYRDDFGKPATDGNYYADIAIFLQQK